MQFSIVQELAFEFSIFACSPHRELRSFILGDADDHGVLRDALREDRFVTDVFVAWIALRADRLRGTWGDHMAALALVMADLVSQPDAYPALKTLPPFIRHPHLDPQDEVERGLTGQGHPLPNAMSRDFFQYVLTLNELARRRLVVRLLDVPLTIS